MIRVWCMHGEAQAEVRTDAPYSPDVLDDLTRSVLELVLPDEEHADVPDLDAFEHTHED